MSTNDEWGKDDMGMNMSLQKLEVTDVSEETMPKTDISVFVVRVSSPDHVYEIPFKPTENDHLELFSGYIGSEVSDKDGLQAATTVAIEHLRTEHGRHILLESTAEESAKTGPFDVYFTGGWGAVHIFGNNDVESICNSATVTAGRRSLDDIENPVSRIDGICPKCLRQLKLNGHFESYERPKSNSY